MNARSHSIFRLYQLFSGIAFTGPIWAVYLLSRGLTLTEFGLVEASLHVGMLAAQVPTGALADSLGRRRMMVMAGAFTALGELGYVFAPTFGLICLAGAVHGISFALRTGTDEAYLFDSLAHDDAQAQFPRMLGGLWAVFQFATAISYMAGGLIASYWSRPAAFFLTAGVRPDRLGHRAQAAGGRPQRGGQRRVGGAARVGALRRSPRLATLTFAWSLYWAANTAWWFYIAPFYASRGATDTMLGFALGSAMLVGAGFSWVGGRIGERVPMPVSVAVATGAAGLALMIGPSLPGLALPVLVLMIVAGAPELVYVTLSTYLQHNTRSEYRATSMSIAEGGFSIQMLWLFPLIGYLIQHEGYTVGFTLCAVLLMVRGRRCSSCPSGCAGLEPVAA